MLHVQCSGTAAVVASETFPNIRGVGSASLQQELSMRLRPLLVFTAMFSVTQVVIAQSKPAADSQRVGGSLRVLEIIQGFQMASSPELASAINALLSDDATHMHMGPRRALAAGDSARA